MNCDTMIKSKHLPEELVLTVKTIMGCDPAHGWPHILRVYAIAEKISMELDRSPDWSVLEPAIIFHDIGRFLPGKGSHAEKSALIAPAFLKLAGFSNRIDEIVHAILAHSYSLGVKAKTLEAMILSDADKLDAIGAIGIARVFHTGCQLNRGFEESLRHFREKIIELPKLMYLDVSRKMAERRIKIVLDYVGSLEEELELYRDK